LRVCNICGWKWLSLVVQWPLKCQMLWFPWSWTGSSFINLSACFANKGQFQQSFLDGSLHNCSMAGVEAKKWPIFSSHKTIHWTVEN
jgi:hypothetical protein